MIKIVLILLIIFRKTTISAKKKKRFFLTIEGEEMEMSCREGIWKMGCWEVHPLNYFCAKPPRLAGRVADTTCFGQRSSPLPTIPAPAI